MRKFVLCLLVFVVVELGCSLTLELKRHETRKEKLIRTGGKLADFYLQQKRLSDRLSYLSTVKPKKFPVNSLVQDFGFSFSVGFGTPVQALNLVPSITQGDTWVVDSKCKGETSCPDMCKKRGCNEFVCDGCCWDTPPDHCSLAGNFSSDKSSTYVKDGRVWEAEDMLAGFYGVDTLRLPGLSGSVDVSGTTFAQASELAEIYIDENKVSGIFGLGRETNNLDINPVFTQAIERQVFSNPFFSLWLNMKKDKGRPDGQLIFGDYASGFCSDVLTTAQSPFYGQDWTFDIHNLNISAIGNSRAALAEIRFYEDDILIPFDDFQRTIEAINATYNFRHQKYEVKCGTKLNMLVNLPQADPLFLSEDDLILSSDGGKTCILTLGGLFDEEDRIEFALGRNFFRNYCVTFNEGEARIEFSKLK